MKRIFTLLTLLLYSFRSLLFSGPPGIRILMFHKVGPKDPKIGYEPTNIPPERFEEQIALLSKAYNVISLHDAIALLKSGIDVTLKRPNVVITFNDGFLDNLTHALPILEKYNLPATLFITTQCCDQSITHPRYNNHDQAQHLTWDQVRELSQHPLITLGSHTLTHPFLSQTDQEQSYEEIIHSKAIIEEAIGRKIDFFCYPSGNYSERELTTLSGSNYIGAVTVKPGSNSIATPRLELRRTEVTEKDTPLELKKKLTGCYDWLYKILDIKRENGFKKARKQHAKKEKAASKQAEKMAKEEAKMARSA